MENLIGLLLLSKQLNNNVGYNYNKYPVLKTKIKDSVTWWDKLNSDDRFEVAYVALHYNKMTANSRFWRLNSFVELGKKQQSIIRFIFSVRNEYYSMVHIICFI